MSSEAIYRVVDAVKRAGILDADDILVHTRKTDDELKKGLLQVETFWRKRFVAYSPTIEVSCENGDKCVDVLRGAKKGQAAVHGVCAEGKKLCKTVSLNI